MLSAYLLAFSGFLGRTHRRQRPVQLHYNGEVSGAICHEKMYAMSLLCNTQRVHALRGNRARTELHVSWPWHTKNFYMKRSS